MTPHFSLPDFVASETAARRRIDNSLPASLMGNALKTLEMAERIRLAINSSPMKETSGYRCAALNTAIGGSLSSDHIHAMALDFTASQFGTPFSIALLLSKQVDKLEIGQLILEFGSWVHVSTRKPGNPINRILTIDSLGTRVGIQPIRK